MPERVRRILPSLMIVVVALAVFVPTLNWGLPTRETDRYLFGDRKPWTGAEILALLGESRELGVGSVEAQTADPSSSPSYSTPHSPLQTPHSRGADVDADPIMDRTKPVVLNDTDQKRAAIVQRYRLMSGQPDEFIQFKALAEMNQRQGLSKLDPRLYQYGGLWIYPVGALVKASMVIGLIESPPPGVNAKAFYLDRPDVFGRFYVIARAYSTFWGVIAALAIGWIATRSTNSAWLGVVAAICFILLPVTRTAAHEAKPHLAGAALCLCAVVAGTKYVESKRRRWLLIAGALCGAAMGMVVSMLLSMIIVPTAWWLAKKNPVPRARGRGQGEGDIVGSSQLTSELPATSPSPQPSPPMTVAKGPTFGWLLLSLAAAAVVYVVTNPFVIYNAIAHPEILQSNLGNSTAMYGVRQLTDIPLDAIRIATAGLSRVGMTVLAGALMAYVALTMVAARGSRRAMWPASSVILASVSGLVALQFVLLCAGKPSEYARFGLIPAGAGVVLLAMMIRAARDTTLGRSRWALLFGAAASLLAPLAPTSARGDVNGWNRVAAQIETHRRIAFEDGATGWRVGLFYEPAPWSAPPMNLFEQTIVLVRPLVEELESIDLVVWPWNLSSQLLGKPGDRVDWRENGWGLRSEDQSDSPRYRWH
jgi:hypothetical protein